jgi:hypothetical protein
MQRLPSKVADDAKPPKEKNPRKTPWRNEPPQLRDDLYRAFGVDLRTSSRHQYAHRADATHRSRPRLVALRHSRGVLLLATTLPRTQNQWRAGTFIENSPSKNRAALALRMGAQGLHRSQSFLGDYFRRMKARMGTPKAMTAAAHKLARIVYHMITTQQSMMRPSFNTKSEERRIGSARSYMRRPKNSDFSLSLQRLFLRRAGLRFTRCVQLINGPIQHRSSSGFKHNISFTPPLLRSTKRLSIQRNSARSRGREK